MSDWIKFNGWWLNVATGAEVLERSDRLDYYSPSDDPTESDNQRHIFTGSQADALRRWLDARTAGAGQVAKGRDTGAGWAVQLSPVDNDCQSVPLGNDHEIEYRRGEHKPYILTFSGDPLEGFDTALEAIHASGLLDAEIQEREQRESEYRQREGTRYTTELEAARYAFEQILDELKTWQGEGNLDGQVVWHIENIKRVATEAERKASAATIPF